MWANIKKAEQNNYERKHLKLYKVMEVLVLLCGRETCTLKKRCWNRIQAAEIKLKNRQTLQ
jgi:hypothetical protein